MERLNSSNQNIDRLDHQNFYNFEKLSEITFSIIALICRNEDEWKVFLIYFTEIVILILIYSFGVFHLQFNYLSPLLFLR